MACIDRKGIIIVVLGLRVDEQGRDIFAQLWNLGADPSTRVETNAADLMNVEHIGETFDSSIEVGGKWEKQSPRLSELGHRSKRHVECNLIFIVVCALRESNKALGSTLRVAEVGNLLVECFLLDVFNVGLYVVPAHILPGIVPKFFFLLIRVILNMGTTVGVATRVSEPDIIAGTSEDKSGSNLWVVHYPAEGRVE